jgi:dTDP-4-amino-4,6-dideoxygalactose transaminase
VSVFSGLYKVPLSVPYWDRATYRAISTSLFSGRLIRGPGVDELRSLILDRFGVEQAVPCGSGSLALEIALRLCGVRPGDEVVIPTFCCTSIVRPVHAIGARPVLADSGEDLNVTAGTIEPVLTKKTRAIVVPHLFGNPADIRTIIDLAHVRDIRIIDDAAQALGATIDGQPAGSFGDAGVLSFGSEKICSGLGGGVLLARRRNLLDGGAALDAPRFSEVLRGLLSALVWRRWRRWTLPLQSILNRRGNTGPDSPPASYRREAMANVNAAVAAALVRTLAKNIAARRARVQIYLDVLGASEGLSLVPHRQGSACLTQVVRVLPKSRRDDASTEVIAALGKAGYEVQGSYVPIHLLPHYRRIARRLPYAERVWPDLVELPCDPEVSFQHVARIAAIVKQVTQSR